VNNGKMPIAACSTACSVPAHAAVAMPAIVNSFASIVYQTPRVTSRDAGRSSASVASTSPVLTSLR